MPGEIQSPTPTPREKMSGKNPNADFLRKCSLGKRENVEQKG
jgi:hypothetical protein